MLERFVAHRRDVVTRRTRFELKQARAREHILLGLQIALDHIDEIIELIRKAARPGRGAPGAHRPLRPLRAAGQGHPRDAAAAPHRPRAAEDPRRAGRGADAHRPAAGDPGLREGAARRHRGRARGGEAALRRRAAHRDPGRGRRPRRGGPHQGGGDGGHRLPRRLREAESHLALPGAAPGREGEDRRRHPRRGLPRDPLRRLHPQLPAGLLRQGQGLLAQGPRDPPGRAGRARQAHRQPGAAGAGREGGRHPPGARAAGAPGLERRRGRRRGGGGRARRAAGPSSSPPPAAAS